MSNTSTLIERLQDIMQSQSASDHEWWDADAIMNENKSDDEKRDERIKTLDEQGITKPLHKHNQIDYELEKNRK